MLVAKPPGKKPKLVNCKPEDVWSALNKIGGFRDKKGSKHGKVEHIATGHCSTIPRHSPINRSLLQDFIDDYVIGKCGVSPDEIYAHLKC